VVGFGLSSSMSILDPITHGFQLKGAWLGTSCEHPVSVVLPGLVQWVRDLYCSPVACKAGVLTCGAVCDVVVVRAWLRGRQHLSSASTVTSRQVQPISAGSYNRSSDDEVGHGAPERTKANVVSAAMQGHCSAVLALLLALGAGVGCTAWRQRRVAVARRKPKARKMLGVAAKSPSSASSTSSIESSMSPREKIPRTHFACGGTIARNPPDAKMPSNTQTALQPKPLGGTNFEPEEEDVVGCERSPMPAGYAAHRTAEFYNKVPLFTMDTGGGLMLNHNDSGSDTKDGKVVPEGFVRAYAQDLQNQFAMHGTRKFASRPVTEHELQQWWVILQHSLGPPGVSSDLL